MQIPVLRYRSGEEIKRGDRVTFAGKPAQIELVACNIDEPDESWYVSEFGGGVMIAEPMVYGRVFISTDELDETCDLNFVSRAQPNS